MITMLRSKNVYLTSVEENLLRNCKFRDLSRNKITLTVLRELFRDVLPSILNKLLPTRNNNFGHITPEINHKWKEIYQMWVNWQSCILRTPTHYAVLVDFTCDCPDNGKGLRCLAVHS